MISVCVMYVRVHLYSVHCMCMYVQRCVFQSMFMYWTVYVCVLVCVCVCLSFITNACNGFQLLTSVTSYETKHETQMFR